VRGTWQTTSGGGGGLVLAVIAVAVLIGSGAAAAIASALVTIAIITGVVIVLAVAGVVALLVYRTRQDRPGRPIAARPVYQVGPEMRPHLEGSYKTALEPREIHLHFHTADPAEAAAIIRTAIPGPAGNATTERKRP
jgi:hypothetical protein